MKSGSFSSYRAALSGTGADFGGERDEPPPVVCRGCGKPLLPENEKTTADGCPCNSRRGINHGLVPVLTCTCEECDPAQTGSVRRAEPAVDPCPTGLYEDRRELWYCCTGIVNSHETGDDLKQMALGLRQQLRLEARVTELTELFYAVKAERDKLRRVVLAAHREACSKENCALDGGPEHDEAFDIG